MQDSLAAAFVTQTDGHGSIDERPTTQKCLLTRAAAKPKLASRPKSIYTRGRVFFISPLAAESPRKNSACYDELVSGRTVYAYVGGNPVSNSDPNGLWTIGIGNYGSAIGGIGGGVGSGIYFGYSNGQFNYGTYVSGDAGAGVNISAGTSAVYVSGSLSNFMGPTITATVGSTVATGSAILSTDGNVIGAGISFGPTLPITASLSLTTTLPISGGSIAIPSGSICH